MSESQRAPLQRFAELAVLTETDHSQHPHESQAVGPGCTEVVKDQEDTVRTHSNSHHWVWLGMDGLCGDSSEASTVSLGSGNWLGWALCIWLMVIPTCVLGKGNYRASSTPHYWWPWNAMCQEMAPDHC